MPADLTIFAAKYLVLIEALLAALVLVPVLWRQPRVTTLRWVIATGTALLLAYILAQVGAGVYNDPRPFTQDHVRPLIAHAADNGFPSDHALLAAAIVAAILLIRPFWAAPFAILSYLVDWARVGAGIHHVADVVGSSVFVAVGMLVGMVIAPGIVRLLLPYLPAVFSQPNPLLFAHRSGGRNHR